MVTTQKNMGKTNKVSLTTVITSTIALVSLIIIGTILGIKNTPGAYDLLPQQIKDIAFVRHSFDGSISGKEVRKIIESTKEGEAFFVHTIAMGTKEERNHLDNMEKLSLAHKGWLEGKYSQMWEIGGIPVMKNDGEYTTSTALFVNYRGLLSTAGRFEFTEEGLIFSSGFATKQADGKTEILYNNEISGIKEKSSLEYIDKSARYMAIEILDGDGNKLGTMFYEIK